MLVRFVWLRFITQNAINAHRLHIPELAAIRASGPELWAHHAAAGTEEPELAHMSDSLKKGMTRT